MEPLQTADGSHTLISDIFQEAYHSHHGALTESRHVFIEAGFKPIVGDKKRIDILEIGMGTGLNVLLTALVSRDIDTEIYFTSYELYPVQWEIVQQLNYPALIGNNEATELLEWIHMAPWEQYYPIMDNFHLRKHKLSFDTLDYQNEFNLIYLDAFAPEAQPEYWQSPFVDQLYAALNLGGILVTYCAKGSFKRALKSAGFHIEALPGPPGKREMTKAIKTLL